MRTRKLLVAGIAGLVILLIVCCAGCFDGAKSEKDDRKVVNDQQQRYAKAQPLPMFDFSNPRDVLIQIYNVVTAEARNTYTVIQSMTGEVVWYGPTQGYAIPADTQLTNPLQPAGYQDSATIDQAEPNGLFSSKNTDGTWVLAIDTDGNATPIYTEQKVTTYPFAVARNAAGVWVRADNQPASMTVKMNEGKKK